MPDPAPIPFAYPYIQHEEEEAVIQVLRSGWLTTGEQALSFEKEFAGFFHDPGQLYCMAVNSATSGLHLALEACGVTEGDVVFVPSYTFTSSAEVVRYLGADPVFIDSLPDGFHIDPAALEQAITNLLEGKNPYTGLPDPSWKNRPRSALKAVVPVHYGGLSCDMDAIMDIARRYKLRVVEDAAHSFPSFNSGRWAGTSGDAGVFSFYATKTLATGEGGMVVCRDKAMAGRISIMRSHGIDRSVWNRYTDTKASWYYEVVDAGYKYNLPDILAAIGRVQLSRAMELLSMREAIAARYNAAFANCPYVQLPPSDTGNAWHLYPLRLNLSSLKINRDEFIAELQKKGIGVSVHFIPLHTMPFYKNRYSIPIKSLPRSMDTYKREISLPIWPGMNTDHIERVINAVLDISNKNTLPYA
ncbi:MAG: DegT/DnrJ/EryC1/StrS family aminotransferase [Treponema sp.]|nr:DegT/DnrJ/EryC1/StrS family aminotransferase [Treponema sp.]